MALPDDALRCAQVSLDDAEPMTGTAPTDTTWLFVEDAGPWASDALASSRLPEPVRARLGSLEHTRVQLVRRHGGEAAALGPARGVQLFHAELGGSGPARVRSAHLDDASDLGDLGDPALDLADLPWTPHPDPLWLVCTNGRRDVCCAERGRPLAAALSARWPTETWETTHLGGHRFAGTLLALPSGLALGRVDAAEAVAVAEEVLAGRVPLGHLRGRAGRSGAVQAAEDHVRRERRVTAIDAVTGVEMADGRVRVEHPDGLDEVAVTGTLVPRRQSCAKPTLKPATTWSVQ